MVKLRFFQHVYWFSTYETNHPTQCKVFECLIIVFHLGELIERRDNATHIRSASLDILNGPGASGKTVQSAAKVA